MESVPSNSQRDTTLIGEQPYTSTRLKEHKQRLASAKRLFMKLAKSYLDKRAPFTISGIAMMRPKGL